MMMRAVSKHAFSGAWMGVLSGSPSTRHRDLPTAAHLKLRYGPELAGKKLFIADSGNNVNNVN